MLKDNPPRRRGAFFKGRRLHHRAALPMEGGSYTIMDDRVNNILD
jgi:hypothetical protein